MKHFNTISSGLFWGSVATLALFVTTGNVKVSYKKKAS